MIFFNPAQQPLWLACFAPFSGKKLVTLAERGIDMDSRKNFIQADAMLHRHHIFANKLAGMITHDRRTQTLFSRRDWRVD